MSENGASQRSIAAALKQVFVQVGRILEEEDPERLLSDSGSLNVALQGWRRTVAEHTRSADRDRERRLENEKLALMGQRAVLEKEVADLQARNADLLNQIVRLNERDKENRQKLMEAQFHGGGAKAENKQLDLEIRDLRRRIRELEGGPALKPSEAAPRYRDGAANKPRKAKKLVKAKESVKVGARSTAAGKKRAAAKKKKVAKKKKSQSAKSATIKAKGGARGRVKTSNAAAKGGGRMPKKKVAKAGRRKAKKVGKARVDKRAGISL